MIADKGRGVPLKDRPMYAAGDSEAGFRGSMPPSKQRRGRAGRARLSSGKELIKSW
jgi:hypothetical protein